MNRTRTFSLHLRPDEKPGNLIRNNNLKKKTVANRPHRVCHPFGRAGVCVRGKWKKENTRGEKWWRHLFVVVAVVVVVVALHFPGSFGSDAPIQISASSFWCSLLALLSPGPSPPAAVLGPRPAALLLLLLLLHLHPLPLLLSHLGRRLEFSILRSPSWTGTRRLDRRWRRRSLFAAVKYWRRPTALPPAAAQTRGPSPGPLIKTQLNPVRTIQSPVQPFPTNYNHMIHSTTL